MLNSSSGRPVDEVMLADNSWRGTNSLHTWAHIGWISATRSNLIKKLNQTHQFMMKRLQHFEAGSGIRIHKGFAFIELLDPDLHSIKMLDPYMNP
jgi:hypothetical protein